MAINFDNTSPGIVFLKNAGSGSVTLVFPTTNGSSGSFLKTDGAGNLSWSVAGDVWTSVNDGAGSGLDADLLDGQDSTFYTNIPARLGYTPLNKAGDSLSAGNLTLFQDPSQPLHAATKSYVDGIIGTNRSFKQPARVATTGANITLVGGAPNVLDGVSLLVNDRILVKDQTAGAQNGLYVVQTLGTGANGTWVRSADADTSAEVVAGTYVFVLEGSANSDTSFVLATNDPITLDTTSLSWVQFSSLGQLIAGTGLVKTGNTVDAIGTLNRISVAADSIDIAATYVGQTSITTLGTITTGTWSGIINTSGANTVAIGPTSTGTLNNLSIGATTRSTGAFTTLTANNAVTLTQGTGSTNTTTGTLVVTGGVGISENVFIGGNLTINGTTTTFNSTTVTIDDPIFTIGGDTAPVADDNKDRGIEFRWHNGTTAKVGFFGFSDSTGFFTFIPDATNTAEVFSGTQGTIEAAAFKPTSSTAPANGLYLPAANTLGWSTASTARGSIDASGNFVWNTAALATGATDGFLYITSSAGKPTGTATTFTGRFPIHIDSSDNVGTLYTRLTANGAIGWYPASKRRRRSETATVGAAPTVSFDCSLSDTFDITLGHTGNATLNFINAYDGQQVALRLRQDATGTRTVTWGTMVRFGVDIPSVTLTTTINKTDYIGLTFHNGDSKYDVVAFSRGY